MIMVMLSQPTPPVSELEARQLSIMFSQILSRSCLAAMPRRTNSVTAWEDWQSQIPEVVTRVSMRTHGGLGKNEAGRTVTCDHQELVVIREVMYHNVRVGGHNLLLGSKLGALLELEIADGSGESEVAVDPSKVDEATSGGNSCLLAWER